jgi:putative addiction module killer protein
VYEIQQTDRFETWFVGLRDPKAVARILARLNSLRLGNFGDCKSLGGGLGELRIHVGPGYRLYFTVQARVLVILICGGDKSTQKKDIGRARRILKEIQTEKK